MCGVFVFDSQMLLRVRKQLGEDSSTNSFSLQMKRRVSAVFVAAVHSALFAGFCETVEAKVKSNVYIFFTILLLYCYGHKTFTMASLHCSLFLLHTYIYICYISYICNISFLLLLNFLICVFCSDDTNSSFVEAFADSVSVDISAFSSA